MTVGLKPICSIRKILNNTKTEIGALGALQKEGGKRTYATRITKNLEVAEQFKHLAGGTNDETQKQQFMEHYHAYIKKATNAIIKGIKSDNADRNQKNAFESIGKKIFGEDFDAKKHDTIYKPLRPLADNDRLIKLEDLNKNLTISTKKQEKSSIWMPLVGGLLGGAILGGFGAHSLSKPKADAAKVEDKADSPADAAKSDEKAAPADTSDKKA